MIFEWDEGKARANKAKHGVDFGLAPQFDINNAAVSIDADLDYGEERLKAVGLIGADLYVMLYVERGDTIRVISLRKANAREMDGYY